MLQEAAEAETALKSDPPNDNFKDGPHKPTFHQESLLAPMEAGNFMNGLHKPTFHKDGLQAVAKFGDNFKGSSQARLP